MIVKEDAVIPNFGPLKIASQLRFLHDMEKIWAAKCASF